MFRAERWAGNMRSIQDVSPDMSVDVLGGEVELVIELLDPVAVFQRNADLFHNGSPGTDQHTPALYFRQHIYKLSSSLPPLIDHLQKMRSAYVWRGLPR